MDVADDFVRTVNSWRYEESADDKGWKLTKRVQVEGNEGVYFRMGTAWFETEGHISFIFICLHT